MKLRAFSMWCVLVLAALVALSGCGRPRSGAKTGMVQIKGSDTMVNLGQAWAEAYMKEHPDADVAVTGGGSAVGIAALIQGTADIAEASRAIKPEEIKIARQNKITPVEHQVAMDALSVMVNPSNPVGKLTIDQLSDIYTGKITNWKQIGCRDEKIVVLSRERNSGTHVFFLEHVVRRGNAKRTEEFAKTALMMPSSQAIADEVATGKAAIGYVGLGYVQAGKQKTIAVAKNTAGPFVDPSIDTALNGTYPIARPLYWYTNGQPTGEVKNLLDFVLSADGQKLVDELGFAPIKKV